MTSPGPRTSQDLEALMNATATLVNTLPTQPFGQRSKDRLKDSDDLGALLTTASWGSAPLATATTLDDLQELRTVRSRLRRLWLLTDADLVDEVNQALRQADARPQLARDVNNRWQLLVTMENTSVASHIAAQAALAVMDLLRTGETGRLKLCASASCQGVLYDSSRNRSRQFCSSQCGNREHVAGYRSRSRSSASSGTDSPAL